MHQESRVWEVFRLILCADDAEEEIEGCAKVTRHVESLEVEHFAVSSLPPADYPGQEIFETERFQL